MKKNNQGRIKLKTKSFPLVHLLGNDEEKKIMYADYRCPINLLSEAFNEWKDTEDARGQAFKTALAVNPSLNPDQVFYLSQDKNAQVSNLAFHNINHPTFVNKILEDFHRHCWLPLQNLIPDLGVIESLRTQSILTGGALVTLIRRNSPHLPRNAEDRIKDFDFYFTNETELIKVINHFLHNLKPLDSHLPEYTPIPENLILVPTDLGFKIPAIPDSGVLFAKYKPNSQYTVIITNNAITVKQPNNQPDFQFIFKLWNPDPLLITQTFDFAHCRGYLVLANGTIHINPETYHCIAYKRIIFKGGLQPFNSLLRAFALTHHRKWGIDRLQLFKLLAYASTKINFSDSNKIKEALKGFYLEQNYPEIKDLPDNQLLSLEELFTWLDELSY